MSDRLDRIIEQIKATSSAGEMTEDAILEMAKNLEAATRALTSGLPSVTIPTPDPALREASYWKRSLTSCRWGPRQFNARFRDQATFDTVFTGVMVVNATLSLTSSVLDVRVSWDPATSKILQGWKYSRPLEVYVTDPLNLDRDTNTFVGCILQQGDHGGIQLSQLDELGEYVRAEVERLLYRPSHTDI